MSLEVINLCFSYNSNFSLNNVSLKVDKGKVLALIGPNGAGKSTLLKCIVGIIKPNSGKIIFDGKDISNLSERERAKIIAYLPQYVPIIFPITVFDSIILGRLPFFDLMPSKQDYKIVENIINYLNLSSYSNRYIDELSGGERQRVHIARVIAQETKVILLDELSANLDIKYQHEVLELITKITHENNKSTIIALHDINLALKYADEIAIMNNGKIVKCGHPEEIITKDIIKQIYGIDVDLIDFNGRKRILI
ncbi:MAG: ABC transporter ATP-binding protein [Candidatus Methanomethylicaceae archaeon]|nr:ABC transporter ATP-binding protein [Candidatus Verstraetearchaeota archaeon]